MKLNEYDSKEIHKVMYILISEITTFEIGGYFCEKKSKKSLPYYSIDKSMFYRLVDIVFVPVNF